MNSKQKMRLSDAEMELLKATFADRGALLLTLRNIFFGLDISEEEKAEVKQIFASSALRRLVRKQFLPEFQPDIPIAQNIDMYVLADIKGKTKEQIYQEVEATKEKLAFIEMGLSSLNDPYGPRVDLKNFSRNDLETNLAGRNLYINHIDRQLQTIEVLAGQKTETVEETKARLLKDSTK